jgi:nicotinamidase-related amidase
MALFWIAAAVLAVFVAYVLNEIRRIGIPTTGPEIDRSRRPNTALLVIDMQNDFTTAPAWTSEQTNTAMSAIKTLVSTAHSNDIPVIEVRHVFRGRLATLLNGWFNQGRGNEGSPGLGTDTRLALTPDLGVEKSVGDAFSNPALDRFLADKAVGTLILTGLDGCHCVNKTARGALNRGFDVRIATDAVLAANDKHWGRVRDDLNAAGARLSPGTGAIA